MHPHKFLDIKADDLEVEGVAKGGSVWSDATVGTPVAINKLALVR